jgi:GTP-binding protein EngB required for normal cell division
VVTKCDKLSRNELRKQTLLITKTLGIEEDGRDLLFFSAKTEEGKDRLWREIQRTVAPPEIRQETD